MAPRAHLLLAVLMALLLVRGDVADSQVLPANCASTYNRGQYSTVSPLPQTCSVNSTYCRCDAQTWAVAPWLVLTETDITQNYLNASAGMSQFALPYIRGIYRRSTCCAACAANNKFTGGVPAYPNGTKVFNCAYWMHYVPSSGNPSGSCSPTSADTCGYCIIFPVGSGSPLCNNGQRCVGGTYGTGYAASVYATVGKGCPGGKNDPHFVGGKGTHFDFNGVPDRSFCLLTDRKFQVNMAMRGYYDTRTVGASLLKDGKAVRTWIRELGVVWIDADTGARHAFRMWARDGKSQVRGDGFAGGLILDGTALPRLAVGDVFSGNGGLTVTFEGYEKQGGGFYDVDVYSVSIKGLLEMEIKLRIAHPLLQTVDDAMTHINVRFMSVAATEDVHGVLGQTFREGRDQRAIDYTALSRLVGKDVPADGSLGKGFLDGDVSDYVTSDSVSTDCKYSAFGGMKLPI